MKNLILFVVATALISGCTTAKQSNEYTSLFNGKDLDGWIVKTTGSPVGENPWNFFRVEDGALTVSYADFDKENFSGEFGHIHTDKPYTNYRFRCEYRFIGEQVPGGPSWAFANSGIMLHCRHPEKMDLDQKFPDSAEFQLLGETRNTGALFTPGCKAEKDGVKINGMKSTTPSLPLGEWVKAEAS